MRSKKSNGLVLSQLVADGTEIDPARRRGVRRARLIDDHVVTGRRRLWRHGSHCGHGRLRRSLRWLWRTVVVIRIIHWIFWFKRSGTANAASQCGNTNAKYDQKDQTRFYGKRKWEIVNLQGKVWAVLTRWLEERRECHQLFRRWWRPSWWTLSW